MYSHSKLLASPAIYADRGYPENPQVKLMAPAFYADEEYPDSP